MRSKLMLAGALGLALLGSSAQAALDVGERAPDFTAKAAQGGKEFDFKLAQALKKGPVVLYFFPAAFTPGCTKEAHDFAEASDQFKAAGATLIGVTAGNVDRVAEFSKVECRDKFAVAADPGGKIAATYKSVLKAKPEWSDRTSYVIGRDGKIVLAYTAMNPDEHVTRTLAAVKGLNGGKS